MELTNAAAQTVQPNQDVLFANEAVRGNWAIMHRPGSGLINLRGLTNQWRALFEVRYQGNITVPEGGTPGQISLAIAQEGEPLQASVGSAVPAAVGDLFSVSMTAQIEVPRGCCTPVSIRNISDVPVEVVNSNLTVTRLA